MLRTPPIITRSLMLAVALLGSAQAHAANADKSDVCVYSTAKYGADAGGYLQLGTAFAHIMRDYPEALDGYADPRCDYQGHALINIAGTVAIKSPIVLDHIADQTWGIDLRGVGNNATLTVDSSFNMKSDTPCLVIIRGDDGHIIENLTIIGTDKVAGVCVEGSNGTISKTTITTTGAAALVINSTSSNNTISDNTIKNSGASSSAYGVQYESSDLTCVDSSNTISAKATSSCAVTSCPDGTTFSDFLKKCTATTPGTGGSSGGSTGGTTAGTVDDPNAPSPSFCTAAALLAGASKCCKDPLATFDAQSNTCATAAANIVDVDQDGVPDAVDHCVGVNDPTNVCATSGTTGGSTGGTTGGTTGETMGGTTGPGTTTVACGTTKAGAAPAAFGSGVGGGGALTGTGCNATTPTPNTTGLSPTIASDSGGGSCSLIKGQRPTTNTSIRLVASCFFLVGLLLWSRRSGATLTTR